MTRASMLAPDTRPDRRRYRPEPQAPRQQVTYTCPGGHQRSVTLAAEANPAPSWDCRCGALAHRDGAPRPVDLAAAEHARRMSQVRQRRTPAEGEAILGDALDRLAVMRQAGQP